MLKLLGAAAASLIATAALADAPSLPEGATRAQLVTAAARPLSGVLDGRLWSCEGSVCSAEAREAARQQSVPDECRRAARWLGKIASYQTGATTLSEAQLAECNKGVTRSTPALPE